MSLIGCNSANTLCLFQQSTAQETLITIEAKVPENNSWAAFGIGNKMVGSSLFVFWKNSTGGCVVSSRAASAYALPRYSINQIESITGLDSSVVSKVPNANLQCTIKRPLNKAPKVEKDLIWAIGAGVQNVDDPASTFKEHNDEGTLNIGSFADMSTISVLSLIVSTFLFL